jgi:hypothetical protein
LDKGGLLSKDQTEVTMGFLKLTLTGLALLAGSVFLYEGLGTNFRILDEGQIDLEPYAIPIGVAFLVFSVLIERLWTIIALSPISESSPADGNDAAFEKPEFGSFPKQV